jgi:hypothetical protein
MEQVKFKWTLVGNVMVSLSTGNGVIEQEIWDDYIRSLKSMSFDKYLTALIGQPENSSIRRQQAVEIMKKKKVSVAMVTDDKIVRGLATAASWLGADVKAFSWVQMREATRHLSLSASIEERVIETVMNFKASCEAR